MKRGGQGKKGGQLEADLDWNGLHLIPGGVGINVSPLVSHNPIDCSLSSFSDEHQLLYARGIYQPLSTPSNLLSMKLTTAKSKLMSIIECSL